MSFCVLYTVIINKNVILFALHFLEITCILPFINIVFIIISKFLICNIKTTDFKLSEREFIVANITSIFIYIYIYIYILFNYIAGIINTHL